MGVEELIVMSAPDAGVAPANPTLPFGVAGLVVGGGLGVVVAVAVDALLFEEEPVGVVGPLHAGTSPIALTQTITLLKFKRSMLVSNRVVPEVDCHPHSNERQSQIPMQCARLSLSRKGFRSRFRVSSTY
jgi:hypothetical protein